MKAVILIGGLGTRLYPITYTTPKSLLPIVDMPFLKRSLFWLKSHGIKHVILALSNLATPIIQYVEQLSITSDDFAISFRVEKFPLGSAGALKNCSDLIGEEFLLYNGDILTDLNVSDLVDFHKSKNAVVTATFGQVDDPTHYGIAHMDSNSRLILWQEKPTREEAMSNWGNVGVWVMNPEILDYIPGDRFVSIEKETFPILFERKVPFFGYKFNGYWKDIGTIEKYFQSNIDVLKGHVSHAGINGKELLPDVFVGNAVTFDENVRLVGPLYIGSDTHIATGTSIIGPTSIGESCEIKENCNIKNSLIWNGSQIQTGSDIDASIIASAEIGENCKIVESVVSQNSIIGSGSVLYSGTVLGPSSRVKAD